MEPARDEEVLIYDNTAGSGTIIFRATIDADVSSQEFIIPQGSIYFGTGCYITFSGGTAKVMVYWQE